MSGDQAPRAEFDAHAADYERQLMRGLAASGESKAYFARGRVEALREWWLAAGRAAPRHIVDYGCGIGHTSPLLAAAFGGARVTGVDPSAECVRRAQHELASERVVFETLAEFAPAAEERTDLIYLNGVVHHVPPAERPALFGDLARWLRPGGVVGLFENNPWNPGTRYVMSRIPFDRDAILVSAGEARRLLRGAGLTPRFTGFYFYFPRWLRFLRAIEKRLVRVPLGGQYGVFASAQRSL